MLQASVSTGSGLGGGPQAFHSASHPLPEHQWCLSWQTLAVPL